MAENSAIPWTTHTFNPWVGCSQVGPGCDNCYALNWDRRFYAGAHWGTHAPRRRTSPQVWARVRRWNREAARTGVRTWVFVASLADVFDRTVDPQWRIDLWALIAECKNLSFQIVTKRVGNVSKMLPKNWASEFQHVGIIVTVVTQAECDRDLPKLLALKRRHDVSWVGLSIEPQLERVIPKQADGLGWVITGGESEQGGAPREYDPRWPLDLIDWGKRFAVPIYVKQLGAVVAKARGLQHPAGGVMEEWPKNLRVRQMPVLRAA